MKSRTLNISLPEDLVRRADQVAKQEYRSRSEIIKEALRHYVVKREEWNDLLAYGQKLGENRGFKTEDEVFEWLDDIRHGQA